MGNFATTRGPVPRGWRFGIVPAVLTMLALLVLVALQPTAVRAQDAMVLELYEVVPDQPNAQFPVIQDGQVSQRDPYYDNYSSEHVWSPPPQVIGAQGFALTLQAQATQKTGGGITAGTGVGGPGFSYDVPEPTAWAVVPNGAPGSHSASLSVQIRPSSLNWGSTAELRIGAAWGGGVIYRYRVIDDPGLDDGTVTGETGEPPRILAASVECDSAEIVISALPSLPCRLLISGWQRNTANPVFVELPAAIDGYANHANGLQPTLASGQQDVFNWDEPVYSWGFFLFACPSQQGTGANCYDSAGVPGSASVPFLVRQGDQSVTATLVINMVGRGGGGQGGTGGTYRFGNRAMAGDFLNVETGTLAAGTIRGDWLSAFWNIEVVDDSFARLQNGWRPDMYLHTERQVPEAGPIQPDWWSAMWQFEPVEGTRYFRIRNRAMEGQYLHMERGFLEMGPLDPQSWSTMWWVMD